MAAEENGALRQRFELLKGAEHHKNALIEELLRRLDELTEEFDQERLDHARERHFNREIQLQVVNLNKELQSHQAAMSRDPFVLVLIDGDGMIFHNKLIQQGEVGGREAAGLLWKAITNELQKYMPGLGNDYKVVTRIYANLKGLGDVCYRTGILDRASAMEDFARGFTGSKQLFDFVDVGMGKDRADEKISEIFKLHLHDPHCRHLFFGCSHDNGYARLLEDVTDTTVSNSITLLEGVPFEKELAQLETKYRTARFDGLFRTTKINVYQQNYNEQRQSSPVAQSMGLPAPPSQYQSPYQPTIQSNMTRTPSASTTNSTTLNSTAQTWATAAMNNLHLASPPPTPQPTPITKAAQQVPRNRYGQRVDPVLSYDPNEVKRIKKLKMCNVHFLRDDCPYDPCTHDHDYRPTKNELATLKYVSRMTPCKFGTDCDDLRCIYGHRCPNDSEGKRDCRFGENCRFDREAHGIDRTVVRTMKVGGK